MLRTDLKHSEGHIANSISPASIFNICSPQSSRSHDAADPPSFFTPRDAREGSGTASQPRSESRDYQIKTWHPKGPQPTVKKPLARKGSRKVRTGCLTCKIRKIKCDEGKPFCNRCTSTGRKCDGYAVEPASVLRWQRPQTLQIDAATNDEEAKALQYYHDQVAPVLSGPTDPYFWTHLVVQYIDNEPAVKHAVIAIGLLYGNIQAGVNPQLDDVALSHYNAAIYGLKPMKNNNNGLVLVACILFVCIELLQSNSEAAIGHCNHGLAILESSCSQSVVRDHLLPIFRRLSMISFFSGNRNQEFPYPDVCRCPVSTCFTSFAQAQATIDDIYNQMMRLVRLGDDYRIGPLRHHEPPGHLLKLRHDLRQSLARWRLSWLDLDGRSESPSARVRGGPRINALLKYELSYVWTDMAFAADEAGYDKHLDGFRRVTEQTSEFAESRSADRGPPHFTFEAGFAPSLFFVATKCRALDVRIEALRLLAVLGSPCEAMWDKGELFCIARRLIELEHNVGLDAYGQLRFSGPDSRLGLPADEMRVRHSAPRKSTPWRFSARGGESGGSLKVDYYMRTAGDTLYLREEVLGCEYYSDLSTLDGGCGSYTSSPGSM